MMPEGVDEPAIGNVHPELFAVVAFTVEDLPNKSLAAGHVHVGHDIHPQHELEPSLGDKFAERGGLLGIALQKRPDVGDLVQHKPVARLSLEEPQRFQNVRQSDVEVLFARLEDGPLPVRVRDHPQYALWLGRIFAPRGPRNEDG